MACCVLLHIVCLIARVTAYPIACVGRRWRRRLRRWVGPARACCVLLHILLHHYGQTVEEASGRHDGTREGLLHGVLHVFYCACDCAMQ